MLASINPWVVGGERPFNFSFACRISFRMLAPAVIPTAPFLTFLKAPEEKTQGSLFLEEKNISRVPTHFVTIGSSTRRHRHGFLKESSNVVEGDSGLRSNDFRSYPGRMGWRPGQTLGLRWGLSHRHGSNAGSNSCSRFLHWRPLRHTHLCLFRLCFRGRPV